MYTTPRKVKQESRLRRSMSLTNNQNNGGRPECIENESNVHHQQPSAVSPYYTLSKRSQQLQYSAPLNGIAELPVSGSVTAVDPSRRYSYSSSLPHAHNGTIIIPDVIDVSQDGAGSALDFRNNNQQPQYHPHNPSSYSGPPPYRNPPPSATTGVGPVSPQSEPTSPVDAYHTHSAKFPLTLDSETAKELQNQLAAHQQQQQKSLGNSTIKRSGSAFELERLIEAFNQEQHALVMSSLQQPSRHRRLDGIDNPGLDLGSSQTNLSSTNGHLPHPLNSSQQQPPPPNGKMAGYTFSDSGASQSLSLSSSNTDSLDTVIYKGPNPGAPSVRDWQRSKDSLQQADFGHPSGGGGYRAESQGMFDNRAYPMQQQQQVSSSSSAAAAYQQQPPMHPQQQYNGGVAGSGMSGGHSGQTPSHLVSNGYSMEYRHQQQVQQQQQQQQLHNLSVQQSVHQSAQLHQQQQSSQNGAMTMAMMRQQGQNNGQISYGNNGQSSMKSPMVSQKSLGNPNSASSSGGVPSIVNGGSANGLKPSVNGEVDKKDSKMFPTKTYNHIKDMISSRFGNGNASGSGMTPKGPPLNNSAVNNANNQQQNGGFGGQNGQNSYMESQNQQQQMPTYGMNQHGHVHSHGMHDSFNSQQQPPQPQAPYYTAPPTISPPQNGSALNGNSYRSPNMNDRKNVNTSFRKAIHQSTLKSNLTEESLQLRPIMETSGNGGSNNYRSGAPQYSEPPSPSLHHVERAQRALDKLCEPAPNFTRTGSGPMTQHPPPSMYSSHVNGKLSASQLSSNRFSVTPGPSSSTSTNSSSAAAGAAMMMGSSGAITADSSLAAASSSNKQHHLHQNPTANGNGPSKSGSDQQQQQQPPPLPTSQKPEVGGGGGVHFQMGLPPVLPSVLAGEKRENGDGSSGTMENPNSASLHLESNTTTSTPAGSSSSALALNKSKSEQLKKITADLHNLAISVAAEQQFQHFGGPGGSQGGQNQNSSSSECENKGQRIGSGQSHTTSDSGVGTVMLTKSPLNSISDQEQKGTQSVHDLLLHDGDHNVMDSVSSGNDSEWVDIVEPEIRQILELEKKSKPNKLRNPGDIKMMTGVSNINGGGSLATSTPAHIAQTQMGKGQMLGGGSGKNGPDTSDLMGDLTASPIPHHRLMSGSPTQSPKVPKKFDLNAYNKKAAQNRSQEVLAGPSTSAAAVAAAQNAKVKSPRVPTKVARSNSGAQRYGGAGGTRAASRGDKGAKNAAASRLIKDLGLKGIKLSRHAASQILYPQDDNGDMTSTTTGLDLESMLDGQTEQTSDDDDDMSTTIDTTDAHAIRRQLESLESMYTEVLKVLGAKRFSGGGNRYPTSDLRNAKRRPYGSMSSLPSSVSSRPFRERKLKLDDKKKVKDIKSINKRFQRLESHVVTLARSVAHLSSEMRTQHLMVQEIESIRSEMQQLRNQVLKSSMQNQSAVAAAAAAQNFARVSSGRNGAGVHMVNATDWTSFRNALPSLTNPCRVRKLTKFFGDEPPLVRIFLKKLGYEKYASAFEQERIGIMELPYLTEERLNKMGIPMGPRLRILQEAQLCLKPGYHPNHDTHHTSHHHQSSGHNGPGNLSVYVV